MLLTGVSGDDDRGAPPGLPKSCDANQRRRV